jgi:3-phosphoshikimate 1-carboxyvinyltransferase
MGAIARGRTRVTGFPPGQDCARSVALVRALGVDASLDEDRLTVEGVGADGLESPAADLDAGNSGTTARLACGLLAPQAFDSRLVGDESLSQRPFDRVVTPLARMGASLETTSGKLPLLIHGGRRLHGIDYELPVASAQVKTAVLLAGLYADGMTRVIEKLTSRNHTEIALRGFGVELDEAAGGVGVSGGSVLRGGDFRVPGDFSSAAFFIATAACLPGSDLVVERVSLNETRTALLGVLDAMGAQIDVEPDAIVAGQEPIGTIRVRGRKLHGTTVSADRLPAMIDEIPILAVVATQAEGATLVDGASELRVKESDRLKAIVEGLRALGADVEERESGLTIHGGSELRPAHLQSYGDHRMVMSWAMASLLVGGDCTIDHLDQVKISYPGFWEALDQLAH